MAVLLLHDPRFVDHVPPQGHPERPERLEAIVAGIEQSDLRGELVRVTPRSATRAELLAVHGPELLEQIEQASALGGAHLDPDTAASAESFATAQLAAGAGLTAIERLSSGDAEAAFCTIRPPGHHATPDRAMGFCLMNNVAIAAESLAAAGERVAIVDFDAHHGNGTQDAFYQREDVLFASIHQWPHYPGTGGASEVGSGPGLGATVNVPLPAGATGDVYRDAFERLVLPAVTDFDPSWLLVSAGFDAHLRDPLCGMQLSSGDFARLAVELLSVVPPGRTVYFLEGGYDLDALANSATAVLTALAGGVVAEGLEQESSGGDRSVIADVVDARARALDAA